MARSIDDVEMVPCISSNIAQVGYSEEDNTLFVEVTSGGVYQYSGVDLQTYENLRDAGSVGGYFARSIRGSYPSRRV